MAVRPPSAENAKSPPKRGTVAKTSSAACVSGTLCGVSDLKREAGIVSVLAVAGNAAQSIGR
jgi:hypothetical protein